MASSLKRILFVFIIQLLAFNLVHCQENRFNAELDKNCKVIIKQFRSISSERKAVLDDIAQKLAKKKYVVFTCSTNSRRTLMLQVWAQTAFYYYGVYGKYAFSLGDTITNVYPGVVDVLKEAGFYCTSQKNAEPDRYVISISKEYPINLLSSKDEVGTIDTEKGVVVNICFADEQSDIAANNEHVTLPYQSPTRYEKTRLEKQKYRALNHKIAVEMLYLGEKMKGIVGQFRNASEY